MTGPEAAYWQHMAGGATTVARAFAVARPDGLVLGFTDHDRDLAFEGITFRAESGLTAKALAQGTGLAVDNSEVLGALSSDAITEADILAGRYDRAEVRIWHVNWANPAERVLRFRGHLGEIVRSGGAFTAELRGLAEGLNRPQGRVYHARCSAVLGDGQCRAVLQPGVHVADVAAEAVEEGREFRLRSLGGFADRWFEKGRLTVLTGEAAGLAGVVKNDRAGADGMRVVELWQAMGAPVRAGDLLRIEAGCDKRAETCRARFGNFLNFRGFPHIPGEDWTMAYPAAGGRNDGGSRFG